MFLLVAELEILCLFVFSLNCMKNILQPINYFYHYSRLYIILSVTLRFQDSAFKSYGRAWMVRNWEGRLFSKDRVG